MAKESAKIRREAYVAPRAGVRTDTARKRNTEAGLTEAQRKALGAQESRIRNFATERAVVVGEDGSVNPRGNPMIDSRGREVTHGSSSRVRLEPGRIPENSVLTHNHPSDGIGLAGRVGSAFSGADIRTAANRNLREIRAVTPNYTYSAKRPAGGWKFSGSAFNAEYERLYRKYIREYGQKTSDMLKRHGGISRRDVDVYNNRLNVVVAHRVMKELSAKYGFSYTRRRSS